MTAREKLTFEHPDEVGEQWVGGCKGCPDRHGYLEKPIYCVDRIHPSEANCANCWDREIPGTKNEDIRTPFHTNYMGKWKGIGCEFCNKKDILTPNEYQRLAARTMNHTLSAVQQEDHALKGIASEYGELSGLYQKIYQGHAFDTEHAKKELGDILWFIAEYCTAWRWNLEDIMQMNIDKLRARYPDGFDADHSLHRAEGDI